MKNLLLLIGIIVLSINVNAQQESLFEIQDKGNNKVLLSPNKEKNPFIGKKRSSVYNPTSRWLNNGINSIFASNFTDKQREIISDAKIMVSIYGDWSGEIKYVDFLVPKDKLDEISLEDLYKIQQQIKKIKVPQSENLSVYSTEADYFKLTGRLKYQPQ